MWFDWTEYLDVLWWPKVDTTFDQKKFKKLGNQINEVPSSFNLGTQASKILMIEER